MEHRSRLFLAVCSVYVVLLLVAAVLEVLERILPGTGWSGVFGTGTTIWIFPLAASHFAAISFRNSTAAAVASFLYIAFFLHSLGYLFALWPDLSVRPQLLREPLWAIWTVMTVLNLFAALTMAAFSERCKPPLVEKLPIHTDPVAEVMLHIAAKKTWKCIRPLRRLGIFMLVVSLLFYLIGSDALRGKAVLGLAASIILIADAYLLGWWDRDR